MNMHSRRDHLMKRKSTTTGLHRLISVIDRPPDCHKWEDFFDFSRLSAPPDLCTLNCRLRKNIFCRFLGNYIWIWIITIILVGLIIDTWLLVAFVVVACLWSIISFSTVRTGNQIKSMRPTYDIPTDERVMIFLIIGHVVLYFVGLIKTIYIVSTCIGLCVSLHAAGRSVSIEIAKKRPRKVVASDGFVDIVGTEEEDTLVFERDYGEKVKGQRNPPGGVKRLEVSLAGSEHGPSET